MKGTEKQIAWAENIKNEAVETCRKNIEINEQRVAETAHPMYNANIAAYKVMLAVLEKMFEINAQQDAGWWIDHREKISSAAINQIVSRWAEMIRSGRMTAEQLAAKNGVRI